MPGTALDGELENLKSRYFSCSHGTSILLEKITR